MKINRIILKGVNNFENLDLTFKDEWTGTIPDSLLLMGINGSGKTRILRSISTLWQILGKFLDILADKDIKVDMYTKFEQQHLVALELYDFLPELGDSIWVCLGDAQDVEYLSTNNKDSFFVYATPKSEEPRTYSLSHIAPLSHKIDVDNILSNLATRYTSNVLGGKTDLPNMIFLPSEGRSISQINDKRAIEPEQDKFQWLAKYQSVTERKNSVQNYLFTLKVVDEEKYRQIVSNVNRFLTNKQIVGFDKHTGELLIKTNNGKSHPIHRLSSGEKQVLLMIAHITRYLRSGSIVLIDEPDLHLHTSLTTAFVSFISRIISDQQGQLILASHDTNVWQQFPISQRINLDEV